MRIYRDVHPIWHATPIPSTNPLKKVQTKLQWPACDYRMRTISTIKKWFVIDLVRMAEVEFFLYSHILLTFLWTWQHQRNVDNRKCLVTSEFPRFTSLLVWICGYQCEQLVLDVNYCTAKHGLLAVVTFVEHFRYYLYGQQFTIKTNHASVRETLGILMGYWPSKLNKYYFTIVHKKGSQHGNADVLSRIPSRKCPPSECPQYSSTVQLAYKISRRARVETDEWLEGWTNEDLFEWQPSDLVPKK